MGEVDLFYADYADYADGEPKSEVGSGFEMSTDLSDQRKSQEVDGQSQRRP